MPNIIITGARQNNLKGIDLEIPKHKIVVFTGVSGSGKSSLVFDTLCAEAQRQIIDTFSTFARKRLPKISKPEVEDIRNLSTAIVIDQKRLGRTLRSTVGTVTEIYTYMRMLFSRCGDPFVGWSSHFSFNHPEGMCENCQGMGQEMVIDLDRIVDMNKSVKEGAIIHSDFKSGGWYWSGLMRCGFFDVNKPVKDFTEQELHDLLYKESTSVRREHMGGEYNSNYQGVVANLKRRYINREDARDALAGFYNYRECSQCGGSRINERARRVQVAGKTIPDLVFLEMPALLDWLERVGGETAEPLIRKMKEGVRSLIGIGADYLSLHRPVATLSGGESQRVKMAKQLDCNLVDLMYILDEPSIGLHPRDIGRLKEMLTRLRDRGNTVLVVEHDPDIIRHGDYVVDIGPAAGSGGGRLMYAGSVEGLMTSGSPTAAALTEGVKGKGEFRTPTGKISISGAGLHNLKNVSVEIPTGVFVCVTGVAGSGKSTLIHDVFCASRPEAVVVDQTPVGRSSRSNPMSYVGIFDPLRKLFAQATGQPASLFSFNSRGACPKCNGRGALRVEMSFLDDVKIVCDECGGKRYIEEVLNLKMDGRSIYDIMCTTVDQAAEFLTLPAITKKLKILQQVGLGYLELGQPLPTLSGGEAQRIKLASELHKKGNIYVMDEPTTGLHRSDIRRLQIIIDRLVDRGNTVIVIEHNLDVILKADWVIDMGPEGGHRGGEVVGEGTPREIAEIERSHTGRFLKDVLRTAGPAGSHCPVRK